MIIVFILILIVLLIFCIIKYQNIAGYSGEENWIGGITIAIIGLLAVITWGCITLNSIISERTINQRIKMYEEENTIIQNDVSRIVVEYMNWEQETYDNVKNESPIVLFQLFPELKSSELVSRQIELYINNNNIIRELKEKKIRIELNKFWLYFG